MGDDPGARERILAADADLVDLNRFWSEAILAMNERLKSMLVSGTDSATAYTASIEVSLSFDKTLTISVQSALRSFFIACIIGKWFVFANKQEAADYLAQASVLLDDTERLLYSRKRPAIPRD